MTCHNRRETTLKCLGSLYGQTLPDGVDLKTYLVDDGCTDGTGTAVRELFPDVNILKGDGNLYWCGGMRLAWEIAAKSKAFDYYLWLNDDTLLMKIALNEILSDYQYVLNTERKGAIIIGACQKDDKGEAQFSYGGKTENGKVIPNGQLQKCKYINGNVVLISDEIYAVLGNISSDYTHAMGDYDYGLRAINAGINCYTTKHYIAVCPRNDLSKWCDPNTALLRRLRLLHSPKGLNIKEYIVFRKKYWGRRWIVFTLKVYLRALSPSFYSKVKKLSINHL